MDVIDHGHQRIRFDEITIEPTTRLPKHPFGFLSTFASHQRDLIRCFRQQVLDRLAANRGLDRFSDVSDVAIWFPGANDQMHVFWHEHIRGAQAPVGEP